MAWSLKGKTLKELARPARAWRRVFCSTLDQIRKAKAHPRRFETMRQRSAIH
jgi:hypothetical protein